MAFPPSAAQVELQQLLAQQSYFGSSFSCFSFPSNFPLYSSILDSQNHHDILHEERINKLI